MPAKRLLLVAITLSEQGGGVADVARLMAAVFADYARKRQIQFQVITLQPNGARAFPYPVIDCGGSKARLAFAVWCYLLTHPKTAVMFDHLGPAGIFSFVPRMLRPNYAIFMHGTEIWRTLEKYRLEAIAGTRMLLVNSAYTRQRAASYITYHVEPRVVHLTLEQRPPEGERDQALLDQLGEGYFLIVGRMSSKERYKGHNLLLEAMPHVLAKYPDKRLVIVGGGDDVQRLKDEAENRGLGKSVIFTGFVSEATLEMIYQRCGVFILPSLNEGFGIVYLQAMRAAKPCIALKETAPAEIIQHGESGILVDANGDALADAMLQLSDPALATAYGQAGFERWQAHFSFDQFQERLNESLDDWL